MKLDLVGKQIGPYQVLEEIGSGGMAVVYLARDMELKRNVALKVLRPAFAQDETFVTRFRREAQAMARLRHPNIIIVFTTGQTDKNIPYIAMDLVNNGTLANLIADTHQKGEPADVKAMFRLIRPVVDALATAHAAGIVHRDIKPSNILLQQNNTPVLTDLGIAAVTDSTLAVTSTNVIMGTVEYMSAEQAKGEPADNRSDLYSLGIVIYEMLAGRRPFVGKNPWSIIHKQINDPPPDLKQRLPSIHPDAVYIINRCLEKNPEERYQTAEQLREDIDKFLLGVPVIPPPNDSEEKRPTWLIYAGVGVAAMLIIAFGFIFLPRLFGNNGGGTTSTPTLAVAEAGFSTLGGAEETNTPTAEPVPATETPRPPTATATPEPTATATLPPTSTMAPTSTIEATETAVPTNTATPTSLPPSPTAVPAEPTNTPQSAIPPLQILAPTCADPGDFRPNQNATFRWSWNSQLNANQYLEVRVNGNSQGRIENNARGPNGWEVIIPVSNFANNQGQLPWNVYLMQDNPQRELASAASGGCIRVQGDSTDPQQPAATFTPVRP